MVELPSQPPMEAPSLSPHPPSGPCWTDILRKPPLPKQKESSIPNRILFDGCKSSKGVAVAVVDANAIIQGGEKLASIADKVVSVREVLEEVRDPVSRRRIDFLPFSVETMEPSPESLKKVISFAKETGDLQTLSDVDLKLIALTYTLEAQFHGTNHLRNSPPPLHMVTVKRLPEKNMPGWGNNVPNLAEWEALENAVDTGSNFDSRILPLKDLSVNVSVDSHNGSKNITSNTVNDAQRENQEEGDQEAGRIAHPRKEIDLVGKKMVASGIDASQGEAAEDTSEWMPAVSWSTHKRHLRKARHESAKKLELVDHHDEESIENITVGSAKDGSESADIALHKNSERTSGTKGILEDVSEAVNDEDNIANILMQMRLDQDSSEFLGYDNEAAAVEPHDTLVGKDSINEEESVAEANGAETSVEGLDHVDISSEIDGSIGTSLADDNSSEQSWMLQSLSDSSVTCVTSDFAMQNVILQIGLRLLAPGGMQIRQLHRWILKCHACNKVTAEIGRIFCPKCGNGGTLRKVSVTVGENGIILAARRPRIVRRGTRFSLPLPQGGREAITKNLILREDQLPHNVLYPKLKKKPNKQGMELLSSDDIFSHTGDKKAPLKPPVRKALSVFSGRRNPNDNHFSRRKH